MPICDSMAVRLRGCARRGGPDRREILSITELFGEALVNHRPFVEEVSRALGSFYGNGVRATLASYAGA